MAAQGQLVPRDEYDLHPAVLDVLRFFEYAHLKDPQHDISQEFHDLAWHLALGGLEGPQLTISLQLLLQAKDAAVRASL